MGRNPVASPVYNGGTLNQAGGAGDVQHHHELPQAAIWSIFRRHSTSSSETENKEKI
jgi:hypothetical protein